MGGTHGKLEHEGNPDPEGVEQLSVAPDGARSYFMLFSHGLRHGPQSVAATRLASASFAFPQLESGVGRPFRGWDILLLLLFRGLAPPAIHGVALRANKYVGFIVARSISFGFLVRTISLRMLRVDILDLSIRPRFSTIHWNISAV